MQSARSPGGKPHEPHVGNRVRVGPYEVLAAGTMYESETEFGEIFDKPGTVLVSLTGVLPGVFGKMYQVVWAQLKDFGGVPPDWEVFLRETVCPLLESGETLLVYCAGSHGRTGTFLASLIALLQSPEETPDPIAAVRERHCERAVETVKQATAIFDLRGEFVPLSYIHEFRPRPVTKLGHAAVVMATKTNKKGTTT